VIGAAAFVLLKEFYSSEALLGPVIAQRWQLTLGLTMIAFVALMPKGLIGLGRRFTLPGARP
jgi:branched-chain amino acid transport system permease protein